MQDPNNLPPEPASQPQPQPETPATAVAQLKQQVAEIRKQFLSTVRFAADDMIQKLVSENLQQMAAQEQQLVQQIDNTVTAVNADNTESTATSVPPANDYSDEQIRNNILQFDAGKQAMGYADKSVEQAMKSAMKNLEEIEKNLGTQP
jgi:hypothetical protein